MEVILLDVLVVDRFVERDETPGEVADEEDDDDGAEHQCLTVLVGGVLRVGSRGHGACKGKQKSDPSNACAMKCITYKSSNRDCIVNSFFADFYEFLLVQTIAAKGPLCKQKNVRCYEVQSFWFWGN